MSLSVLARRVAMPVRATATRAFTTSKPRMDFGWSKLVTPLTNPAFISRMKELDAKFVSMKTDMHGVPAAVEPIDWAQWEESIDNKSLVASLRQEYESMKFDAVKGEDLTKINADLDFSLQKARGAAAISREELPKLQAELAAAIEEKRTVHSWTLEDFYKRYPGLEQQLRDEYMNGEFLLSEAEERLEAQDVNEARKQFKSGAEISMPDDLPDRVGDYSAKAEMAKVNALLDRMYGGSKQYEQWKVEQKAKDSKKVQAEHH